MPATTSGGHPSTLPCGLIVVSLVQHQEQAASSRLTNPSRTGW